METQRKQNFVEYIINQKSQEVAVLKDIKSHSRSYHFLYQNTKKNCMTRRVQVHCT